MDWVQACEPKGHQFDSHSGHMQARSPVRGVWEATVRCFSHTLMFLSVSFFLPSPLPKRKQNKTSKALKRVQCLGSLVFIGARDSEADEVSGDGSGRMLSSSQLLVFSILFSFNFAYCLCGIWKFSFENLFKFVSPLSWKESTQN